MADDLAGSDESTSATAPPARLLASVGGRTVLGQVIWLSGPVLVEQALVYLVGLSDTLLTARYLSVEHLAAVTTAAYIAWFVSGIQMVVAAGSTALVSRLTGAGDLAEARRITAQAQVMALLLGSLVSIQSWFFADAVVRVLNLEGTAAEQAAIFLRIVLSATPLVASRTVGIACLRGAGDTRTGMWVMCVVNALNIALSWALVTGVGPFPSLGLRGIALGTAAAELAGGVLVLIVLSLPRSRLRLAPPNLRPSRERIERILRISLPAAGESLVNAGCQLWFLGLINRLGAEATAAHGVALRCEALAFLTLMSFAVAGGTLAGQYLGAAQPTLAARAARTSWFCGLLCSCGLGVALFTQAGPMVGFFLGDSGGEVAARGISVLRLVAFALPALSTIQVLGGVLRGVGDTRWPLQVVLAGYLLVRLPLTYWLTNPVELGGPGLGLLGAWIAMFADLHARAALLAARFLRGRWKRIRI